MVCALTIIPAVAGDDTIRIPIDKTSTSGPPQGWKVKEWKGKADFRVVDTEEGKAIHMKSDSTSSALYREVKFDIRNYPYLNWKWKVLKLPRNADVRKKTADDQAAQVYVVFPRWPATVNSRFIGYIWDSTAPAGSIVTSTKANNIKYFVLRSGANGTGSWVHEKRNVYEDYRTAFREDPPQVGSVSVMIDSDNTASTSEALVTDIFFFREVVWKK